MKPDQRTVKAVCTKDELEVYESAQPKVLKTLTLGQFTRPEGVTIMKLTVPTMFLSPICSCLLVALTGFLTNAGADEGATTAAVASEKKGETTQKSAAETYRDLLTLIRTGDPEEAIRAVSEACEESPLDDRSTTLKSQLATRLLSIQRAPEAAEILEPMLMHQQDNLNSRTAMLRYSNTVQLMRNTLLQLQRPDDAQQLIDAAITRLRNVSDAAVDADATGVIISLISVQAAGLRAEGRENEAESILQAEATTLRNAFDASPAAATLRPWIRLRQEQVRDLAGKDIERAKLLAAEMDEEFRKVLQSDEKSDALHAEYINSRSSIISSLSAEHPDAALSLLEEIHASAKDSEFADLPLTVRSMSQLQSLRRRLESAMRLREMVGKPAPSLDVLATAHGEAITPESLQGKVVLMDFWAIWCGPCIATFPHLREWHETYHDRGFEIVGVTRQYNYLWNDENKRAAKSSDPVSLDAELEMLNLFMEHHQLRHATIITPPRSEMQREYSVTGIPHAVLIDRSGNVRMVKVGSGAANAAALQGMIETLLAE